MSPHIADASKHQKTFPFYLVPVVTVAQIAGFDPVTFHKIPGASNFDTKDQLHEALGAAKTIPMMPLDPEKAAAQITEMTTLGDQLIAAMRKKDSGCAAGMVNKLDDQLQQAFVDLASNNRTAQNGAGTHDHAAHVPRSKPVDALTN